MGYKEQAGQYYRLSKPGIIYGNLITALAGYLYGSQFSIAILVLGGLLVGLTLVIAGACATNNYLDRGIDAKMQRTKKRALVSGKLRARQALAYAASVTVLGLLVLGFTQNSVTTSLAAVAWFAYVVLYGFSKRYSVHGTLVGCISGSVPLIAGYTATVGKIDIVAGLLFLLMTAWQMAHFYGIALYRLKDYKAAGIPVMPAVHGVWTTQLQTLGYILLFIVVITALVLSGHLSVLSGSALGLLGILWFARSLKLLPDASAAVWGRKVFLFSLIVMLGMSIILSLDPLFA